MAVRIMHAKVSGQAAGTNPNKVYGAHWDSDHVVIGLEHVDNTSDADKPISTATQAALDAKQPLDTDLTTIAALSTTGILRRTGSGTWSLGTAVANSELATMAAYTIKGNATGSPASPADVSISSVAVSSIAGLTGAFTTSTGITTSGNDIRLNVGQLPGTTTNDNASAGNIGEVLSSGAKGFSQATVTITIASPSVVTWTSHGLSTGMPVNFTTTGALPTGLSTATNYYIIKIDADTFKLASTAANAIAGTAINTSGSQSGTHTAFGSLLSTTVTAQCANVLTLTAGDWLVWAMTAFSGDASTSASVAVSEINSSEAGFSQIPGTFGKWSGFDSTATAVKPFTASGGFNIDSGPTRKSLATTANVFLTVFSSFTGGKLLASGVIYAQRIR